jgi:hypothetical protein
VSTQNQGDDYPNQEWLPRWWMRLTIRFAEFGQLGQMQQLVPSKPTRSLAGTDPKRNALVAKLDPQTNQYTLMPQGGQPNPQGSPAEQTTSTDQLTQSVTGIVPVDFRWSQNGIRTGDTLSATIRFADCPIDPRTIRSIAVEFYLGTVTQQTAQAQVDGAQNIDDVLPASYTDPNGNPRTNKRFEGWVDKFEITWSDGQPLIALECTDNTRQLINLPAPAKMQISNLLPIDQAIANYLSAFPSLESLNVQYRPVGATPPVIGNVSTAASQKSGKGPPLHANAGTEKMSIWDHLTDVCRSLGHSVYVDGHTIVISRMRSITSANVEPRPDDPYVPRQVGGQTLKYRRFLYGRNVETLKVSRQFTTHAPTNVSVRAYDSEQKKVIVERFPTAEDAQVYALPGNATPDQNWSEWTIKGGIKDSATLRIFAQEIYENLGRQELAVGVTTKNFASFGGGNEDPDLLDMKFGDALEVVFNREDFYSTLNELQKKLDSQALLSQYMQDAGFPKQFSDAYATAYSNAGLQTVFRVHKVEVSGSMDDGVSFDILCVNYVEVTSDKSLPAGEEPAQNNPPSPPAAPLAPPPSPGPAPGTGSGI